MDITKINDRIKQLKAENERDGLYLQNLDSERQRVIQGMLIRNGRILELEELLKEQQI